MNIKLFLTNPKKIPIGLLYRFGHIIPDKTYLKLLYRAFLGKRLDLKNPKTFNEKLQWLKLNDRRDEYTIMVDKVEAKKWVAERIGEEYIIPTIGVWERPEDIDFDSLPEKFVMKTNHDSGMVCICTDKSKLDRDKVRRDMAISLKRDYYLTGREWPYKNVNRRILAEQFMVDESGYELKDYKIFCFDGEPQFIQVDFDRFAPTGHKRNLYSTEWKLLEFDYGYPSDSARNIERPSNLDTMLSFARKLSKGHRFLRTDFYAINGDTKFGEMTFFPECGFGEFSPDEWDTKLGKLIKLKSPSGGRLKWDETRPDPASSPAPYRVYNIGNQRPTKLMDYISCIENAIGREARKEFLPMQPGDVYQTYADSSALAEATGFKPCTKLQDGIDCTVTWFKQYYGLK